MKAKKMKKRTKNLLIHLAILVVLGIAAAVVMSLPKEEEPSDDTIVLQDFDASEIEKMTIMPAGGEPFAFIRAQKESVVKNAEGEDEKVLNEMWAVDKDTFGYELDQNAVDGIGYAFSNIKAQSIVEEAAPEDLTPYGLAQPSVAVAELKDGTEIKVLCGSLTPTGSTYYLMLENDPAIYEVFSSYGKSFSNDLNYFRDKTIGKQIDYSNFQVINIQREGKQEIEIKSKVSRDEEEAVYGMAQYRVTKPFQLQPDIDTNEYQTMQTSLPGLMIAQKIVADNPEALSLYGLDTPWLNFYAADSNNEMRLLFGDLLPDDETLMYCMEADGKTVFAVTAADLDYVANLEPFDVVERFVLLVNIETVDSMDIKGFGKSYTMRIQREESEADENEDGEKDIIETFFIDEKQVNEGLFKDSYELAIGMLADGVVEKETDIADAEASIVYHLNFENLKTAMVEFVPYNDNFYAAYFDGTAEFVIAKKEVLELFDSLNELSSSELTE